MDRSVIETSYKGSSPHRTVTNVGIGAPFTWIRGGLRDMTNSPASSIIWGIGLTIALFAGFELLNVTTTVAFAYIAPIIIIAAFLAGGICATSRQIERGGSLEISAAISQLWHVKLHLLLLALTVAILVTGWMRLSLLITVISSGTLAPSTASFLDVIQSTEGWIAFVALCILAILMTTIIFLLTFLSMPMIIDEDEDFLNAMIVSFIASTKNFGVSLIWVIVVGGALTACMLLWYPILSLIAPIAIHSTWHCYRSMMA